MRRDALLINVSRGKLVDEAALVSALTATPTLGAALDVFEHEPLSADSPLWSLPNVLSRRTSPASARITGTRSRRSSPTTCAASNPASRC